MRWLRTWAELARISNLPTVLSNALAGAVLGSMCLPLDASAATARVCTPSLLWIFILVPCVIYSAGMILNDACDASIDARERPQRPIPSGRAQRKIAFVVAFTLLAIAIGLALFTDDADASNATIALVCVVLLYNFLHARHWTTVLLLAIARAHASLIPMLAFAQDSSDNVFESAAIALPMALGAWTLLLAMLARSEMTTTRTFAKRGGIGWMIACLILIDMVAMVCVGAWMPAGLCALLLVITRAAQRSVAAS